MGVERQTNANGRIILKQILKRQGVSIWFGFTWLNTGANGGSLLTMYESPNSIKVREYNISH